MVGKTPFKGIDQSQTFENITNVEFKFPNSLDVNAKDLLEKIFKAKPEERIGFKSLEELKNHVFFKGIDFKNIHLKDVPYKQANLIRSPGRKEMLKLSSIEERKS